MEALLISNQLERHILLVFMVVGLDHLAEAALPYHLQNLVAICDVVVWDKLKCPNAPNDKASKWRSVLILTM